MITLAYGAKMSKLTVTLLVCGCLVLFYTGGTMSSFLMGCYDPASKKWCTVTKCSGGYDDATLARLQKELDVIKIGRVNIKSHYISVALNPNYNILVTISSFTGSQQDPTMAKYNQELLSGFSHPRSWGKATPGIYRMSHGGSGTSRTGVEVVVVVVLDNVVIHIVSVVTIGTWDSNKGQHKTKFF